MPSNCKVEEALGILVGKWKPVILYHLIEHETLRFSEFQRLIPDVSKKMLTNQLRELEYHDIIHRKVYAEVPPKVEYSMTEYGRSLMPILYEMNQWGQSHMTHLSEIYGEEKQVEKQE